MAITRSQKKRRAIAQDQRPASLKRTRTATGTAASTVTTTTSTRRTRRSTPSKPPSSSSNSSKSSSRNSKTSSRNSKACSKKKTPSSTSKSNRKRKARASLRPAARRSKRPSSSFSSSSTTSHTFFSHLSTVWNKLCGFLLLFLIFQNRLAHVRHVLAPAYANERAVCPKLSMIDLAIVYDGPFCRHYGGQAAAEQRVRDIVNAASRPYEVSGLCATLRLVDVSGECQKMDGSGNETVEDILLQFAWEQHSSRKKKRADRHSTHMFTGKRNPAGDSIGLAYAKSFGTELGIAIGYGMERMLVNDSLDRQAELLAHELGHCSGDDAHDDPFEIGTIMKAAISWFPGVRFSERSKTLISSYLAAQGLQMISSDAEYRQKVWDEDFQTVVDTYVLICRRLLLLGLLVRLLPKILHATCRVIVPL